MLASTFRLFGFEVQSRFAVTLTHTVDQRSRERCGSTYKDDDWRGDLNYDLAIMALEGLARAPLTMRVENGTVAIEGDPASFRELARLCLLIGGGQAEDAFELQPGVHVTRESPMLRLRGIGQLS